MRRRLTVVTGTGWAARDTAASDMHPTHPIDVVALVPRRGRGSRPLARSTPPIPHGCHATPKIPCRRRCQVGVQCGRAAHHGDGELTAAAGGPRSLAGKAVGCSKRGWSVSKTPAPRSSRSAGPVGRAIIAVDGWISWGLMCGHMPRPTLRLGPVIECGTLAQISRICSLECRRH